MDMDMDMDVDVDMDMDMEPTCVAPVVAQLGRYARQPCPSEPRGTAHAATTAGPVEWVHAIAQINSQWQASAFCGSLIWSRSNRLSGGRALGSVDCEPLQAWVALTGGPPPVTCGIYLFGMACAWACDSREHPMCMSHVPVHVSWDLCS
eukprot:6225324-Prymnesium_polylepis.1